MKREIKRKIKELSDEAGSAAAAQMGDEIASDLTHKYDERIKAGMSELDAYRDVLKDIDKIEEILKSLPLTDDEVRGRVHKDSYKQNEKKINKICSSLWILVVIAYILGSFATNRWELTWLIFLWGAVGQNLMDMVKQYNKGTPIKKVLRKGLSAIMWLLIVIFYFFVSFVMGGWSVT